LELTENRNAVTCAFEAGASPDEARIMILGQYSRALRPMPAWLEAKARISELQHTSRPKSFGST
jgi:hypothetical protein